MFYVITFKYWHFEVEINQYDIIWSQKYILTILRVNEVEIFHAANLMIFEFLGPEIKFEYLF